MHVLYLRDNNNSNKIVRDNKTFCFLIYANFILGDFVRCIISAGCPRNNTIRALGTRITITCRLFIIWRVYYRAHTAITLEIANFGRQMISSLIFTFRYHFFLGQFRILFPRARSGYFLMVPIPCTRI